MSFDKPIGGMCEITFNGKLMLFESDLSWNFQTMIKTYKAGRDGRVHGFTVGPNVPKIKAKFTDDGSFTTADLEAITNAIVVGTFPGGRQIILRGAGIEGEIEHNGDEASFELTFAGSNGEEIRAQG